MKPFKKMMRRLLRFWLAALKKDVLKQTAELNRIYELIAIFGNSYKKTVDYNAAILRACITDFHIAVFCTFWGFKIK